MSTRTLPSTRLSSIDAVPTPRSLALLGIATMIAGYCATLYWVTTVAGGTAWLAGSVAIGLGAGVLLRETDERTVLRVAGGGAVLAGALYYSSAAPSVDVGMLIRAFADTVLMLSGITVLRLAAVDVWIAAIVPVPVFLSTYLGLRGRYVLAAATGSWLVVFLAATGDATTVETLLGTIGAVATVGFGEIARRDGSVGGVDLLVALLAIMAVLAVTVPMVPSGSASPLDPTHVSTDAVVGEPGGPAEPAPLDEQLLSGDDVTAGGPINLSTDVRFVVESPTKQRWRLDVLGAYTGDGWTRSGLNTPFMNALSEPPGDQRTVVQQYDLRAEAADLPAASYPVDVGNLSTDDLQVTSTGALTVDGRLPAGTNYTVESAVPTPTDTELRTAGRDYPPAVERRYTRLPEDTVPERVHNLTDQVTAQTTSPLGTAQAIESYLEDSKEYSQNVSAPEGTMVDGFLFEMDAGYCTYYASAMATMLRTQGVPARVAVGYNSGQWVGNDTWVVRGTDAHAWVEVYFPEIGWITFDPTPSTEVRSARRDVIEDARSNATANVDVPASAGEDLRYDPPPTATTNGTDDSPATNGSVVNGSDGASNGSGQRFPGTYSGLPYSPVGNGTSVPYVEPDLNVGGTNASPANGTTANATQQNDTTTLRTGDRLLGGFDAMVLALLLAAGTVAGGRSVGVQRRLRRASSVLWQRRVDPETDAERAAERLDSLLARRYEPRRDGETRRAYRRRLPDSVDPRVDRAFELHERIRYAGEIDPGTVDELVDIVDGLAREELPGIRPLQ